MREVERRDCIYLNAFGAIRDMDDFETECGPMNKSRKINPEVAKMRIDSFRGTKRGLFSERCAHLFHTEYIDHIVYPR